MGIFIFNDFIVFHKLTPIKIVNIVLKGLESKFPIEVDPNYTSEKDFYKYTFKTAINDEVLKEAYNYLSKFNKNA